MKKVKGLRSTSWWLQNSHGDVNYSIGHIVSYIVITMRGARRVPEISGGSLCKVCNCLTTMVYAVHL